MKEKKLTAVLTIKKTSSYDRIDNAREVSKRLLNSAKLLHEGSYACLSADFGRNVTTGAFAVPEGSDTICADDLKWIFDKCADVHEAPITDQSIFEEGGCVYALRSTGCAETGHEAQSCLTERYLCDLHDALSDLGAVAAFTVSSRGEHTILIGIPNRMTLKMRTLLSMAFPETEAVEVKSAEGASIISEEYAGDILTGLLYILMYRAYNERRKTVDTDYEYDDGFDIEPLYDVIDHEEDTDAVNSMPIEDLDLSVRTYNCLKRAGIDSVGELRRTSDDKLRNIRNLGWKSYEEIREKLSRLPERSESAEEAYGDPSAELAELIGLENVKQQIQRIAAFARMKQSMEALGKPAIPIVLNMEFAGNPGTAKTTVARILARMLHDIGLLKSGEIVETGRADLIAKYTGQTADKVKGVFEKARGKLLFIDEAYSLIDCWEGSFGDEAINTIVQEMENNRSETVVVFAGYSNKMERFFERNPGLRSRVPFRIDFPDYAVDDMVEIAKLEAKKRGFSIENTAFDKIASICDTAGRSDDAGNGRFCRNLVEAAILSFASRVFGESEAPEAPDFTLIAEDFTAPQTLNEVPKTARIGFAA
ncbi:MAG: AAA family ATPase [Clostridia bacterium]|nr:AAA family ATPase [Clostridia bacterium]